MNDMPADPDTIARNIADRPAIWTGGVVRPPVPELRTEVDGAKVSVSGYADQTYVCWQVVVGDVRVARLADTVEIAQREAIAAIPAVRAADRMIEAICAEPGEPCDERTMHVAALEQFRATERLVAETFIALCAAEKRRIAERRAATVAGEA